MKRMNFTLLFDATFSNPNGDPDLENEPRTDSYGHGLVTDVCLKYKIRREVERAFGLENYIAPGGFRVEKTKDIPGGFSDMVKPMCEKFFDVPTFGGVFCAAKKKGEPSRNGNLTGAVQFGIARSVCPVTLADLTITVCSQQGTGEGDEEGQGTIGSKKVVEHGLYVVHGRIDAVRAEENGMTEEHLTQLFSAIEHLFDADAAAARTGLAVRGLHVWTHENPRGNEKLHVTERRLKVKPLVERPSCFEDYAVTVDLSNVPEGLTYECIYQDAGAEVAA